jgi:hypothetical protein
MNFSLSLSLSLDDRRASEMATPYRSADTGHPMPIAMQASVLNERNAAACDDPFRLFFLASAPRHSL